MPETSVVNPHSPIRNPQSRQVLVWILFFVSGACGLIYEVIWCRHLGLIFGNTVQSLSAVLTAFMGGLALGSFVAGRYCHRLKRPLLAYGVIEFLIGLYCALLPWVFSDHSPLVPFYRPLYADGGGNLAFARFIISFLLLLIPTTLMGATLPVLSQFLVRSRRMIGRTVGALYAINTFGAVAGAAGAGFFLLPELGKANTNWVAVGCNIVLGSLAIVAGISRTQPIEDEDSAGATGSDVAVSAVAEEAGSNIVGGAEAGASGTLKLAIITFGVTGFAAMATQIGWTRAISLATGSSTYAFSLIVSVFILGLSMGGAWGARIAPRLSDPLAMLAKVLIAIGLFCMALTVALGYGPKLFFLLLAWGSGVSWSVLLMMEALGIAALIIGPTFLMGATLPLTMQLAARSSANAGRTVGSIYAVNTVGAILGSLLGGLVLLPILHIQQTLVLTAALYALPGVLLLLFTPARKSRVTLASLAVITVGLGLVAFFGRAWDPVTMSSGIYMLRNKNDVRAAREFRFLDALPDYSAVRKPVYYKEGAAATVSVTKIGDELILSVGGKPDASSIGDMSTQITSSLVPELLHETDPQDVLVIGLGSGVSAGSALALESIKHVDVVEMSPEVVEGSSYFEPYNGLKYDRTTQPWKIDTPNVRVLINDGRNHLLLTEKRYDVIASEPSNPWLAGVGNLFTREAFELARSRLNPGGIMSQWVHSYAMEEDDFFSIVRTFGEVFPHMQLWCVNRGDYLLLGSDSKLEIPYARLHERLQQPRVKQLLERVHFDATPELLACYLAGEGYLRSVAAHRPVHTDDNMLLEFSAPRALYGAQRLLLSTQFISTPEIAVDLRALPPAQRAAQIEALDLAASTREYSRHVIETAAMDDELHRTATGRFIRQLGVLKAQNPADAERMASLLKGAEAQKARAGALNPVEAKPGEPRVRFSREALNKALTENAQRLINLGDADAALAEIAKMQDADKLPEAALLCARALLSKKEFNRALEQVEVGSKLGAVPLECAELAGMILQAAGRNADALATVEGVLKAPQASRDQAAANLWKLRAILLLELKNTSAALASIDIAERLAPEQSTIAVLKAEILLSRGDVSALDQYRRAAALDPENVEIKASLVETLLKTAAVAQMDAEARLRLLRYARRISRELCKMEASSPRGWVLLCQCLLALEKDQPADAAFYRRLARNAYDKALSLVDGDAAKLPKELVEAIGSKP